MFTGRTDAEAETPILCPPYVKSWLIGKDPDAYTDWKQEGKGMTEDEMVGWHHQLNGLEFGWNSAVGDGQGGLACCGSWGFKELDMTEWLNWTELKGKSVNKCIWEFRSQVTAAISWSKESKSGHKNMTKGYKHDFLGIAVHNAEFLICFHFTKCVCVCVCMCVCVCVHDQLLICVTLFATPWTVACQAPLSMDLFR